MTGHLVYISDQFMSRNETCNAISSMIIPKYVFYYSHDRTIGCMLRHMNNNVDELDIKMVIRSFLW